MKRLLTGFFLALACAAHGQLSNYNSQAYWSRFTLQSHQQQPAGSDTSLVFVTNRFIHPDSLRFVDEFIDTSALKYFFLEKQQGTWKVYPEPTLAEAMDHLPRNRDIVVYAEGMGKIFTSNVERAQLMSAQYAVNVVMFDYASINTTYKPSKNFRFARQNARLSAPQYLQLLRTIQTARENREPWTEGVSVSMFYHSMGNIILERMMKGQDTGVLAANVPPFVDNLIINAACVPMRRHARWVEKIHFAKNVFVHYNKRDMQLKGAHLLTLKRQLGEKVPQRQRASNAQYVNFLELARWQHSYFMNFPYNEYRLNSAMVAYFNRLFNGQGVTAGELTALRASAPAATASN